MWGGVQVYAACWGGVVYCFCNYVTRGGRGQWQIRRQRKPCVLAWVLFSSIGLVLGVLLALFLLICSSSSSSAVE